MKHYFSLYTILLAVISAQASANTFDCEPPELPDPVYGLAPLTFDWRVTEFRTDARMEPPLNARIPTPYGPIEMTFAPDSGYHILVPTSITLTDKTPPEVQVTIKEDRALNEQALTADDWESLDALCWDARVGDQQAILVSVPRQMLYVIQNRSISWQVPIATSKLGTGQLINSMKTPLGWHRISEKYGDAAPWGQVFRSRAATQKIWDGQEHIDEGLVLTRILWLEGLEEGKNMGKNDDGETVDSKQRYIYLHGTNKEHCIGTPMSDGCVNMYNDDVIKLYDTVPVGTPVLIADF